MINIIVMVMVHHFILRTTLQLIEIHVYVVSTIKCIQNKRLYQFSFYLGSVDWNWLIMPQWSIQTSVE